MAKKLRKFRNWPENGGSISLLFLSGNEGMRKGRLIQAILLFLLLLVAFPVWAEESQAQMTREAEKSEHLSVEFKEGLFSVHAKEIPLGKVLAEIEKQSGITISVNESLKSSPVTVDFSGFDIMKSLSRVINATDLGGYGISYKSSNLPGKVGQWVVDKVILAEKGGGTETQLQESSNADQQDKDEAEDASKLKRKPKVIEKEPYFDKRFNRFVEVVKGEVIVRFIKGITKEQIEKFHKEKGTQTLKGYEKIGVHRLKIPDTESVQEFIEKHLTDSKQAYIEPVFLTQKQAVLANDPSFEYQWALPQIQADKAWEINNGSPDIIVAVIDTGVDISHPDLENKVIPGIDIVNGSSTGTDDNGHGTYVAGIIAAESNNSIGIAGISWHSKVMPVKVLNSYGEGTYSDLIEGIIYAVDNGARVINLSLGGYSYSQFLADAIQYAHSNRVIIVAAGGNENTDESLYPASYPNVIGVSATDSSDLRWSSSNYGNHITLSAPGVGVLSTQKDNGYVEATGTSISTAHVSGVAALILSKNPDFSNTQAENILFQTADDLGDEGWDNFYGFGRVNAFKAIEKASIEVHDVAVTGINVEPETFSVGETTKIVVMVENQGTFIERDLLVKVSVNGEAVRKEQSISEIYPGEKKAVSFDWVPKTDESAIISAEVTVAEDEDVSDNKLTRMLYFVEKEGVVTIKFEIKTHRWITYRAVEFLKDKVDLQIYTELSQYIDELKDGAEHEDCTFYNAYDIYGCYKPICERERDVSLRYLRHFYRPIDKAAYDDGYANAYEWGYDNSVNSYDWNDAIKQYKNGLKEEAYFSLGHVLHLIEDVSLPEHTHLEFHGTGICDFNPINQKGYEKYVADKTTNETTPYLLPEPETDGTGPKEDSIIQYDKLEDYFHEMAMLSYYRNRFQGDLDPFGQYGAEGGGKLKKMFPSLKFDFLGWAIWDERVDDSQYMTWWPPYDVNDDWWETKQFASNDDEEDGFYYIEKSNFVIPKEDKGSFVGGTWWPQGPYDTYKTNNETKTLAELMEEDLIPLAIRHVAGAIMLFWAETHPPEITSVNVDPNLGCSGSPSRQWVTINGNWFLPSSKVLLHDGTTGYEIPADRTEFNSSTQIRVCADVWYTSNWTARVVNPAGSSEPFSFTVTPTPLAPFVTTESATGISETGATLNASANANGTSTDVYFEYGTSTSYGSTTPSTNIGSGINSVSVFESITGLNCGITYHFSAVAANSEGTTYGSDKTFTTSACPPPLENWHWRNPLPQGNTLNGVTYGNSTFMAVGYSGTILTSTDGASWTPRTSGTIDRLYGVTYGGGTFMAVGEAGTIVTSPDGISWTLRTSGTLNNLWGVTYGGSTFVAVGDYGTILTSPDGISWTLRTSGTLNNLWGVTYGGSTFVAVGWDGTILTSPDGASWTPRTSGTIDRLYGVTYGGGTFMAVGEAGTILTSPDGASWTPQTSGTIDWFRGVTYGGGTFVAVGSGGAILTSPDGVSWTSRTSGTSNQLRSVTYGGGTFMAVGEAGTIVTSTDAISWTRRTSGTTEYLHGITYGGGTFVAVGCYGIILTSTDGISWTRRSDRTYNCLQGVTYGNGTFVAVGWDGTILTSTDGASWTRRSSETTENLLGVTYGDGTFVAVGDYGIILTSKDGASWTIRTSGTTETPIGKPVWPWYGVTYGDGTFVAVGWDGIILTSTDGISWTRRSSEPYNWLQGVTYGGGTFVAVGWNAILTSTDGISWTRRSFFETYGWLHGVTYEGGTFVVVGWEGTILTSTDGISWTRRSSGTASWLYDVTYGGGTFVVVGNNGTILQSDPVPTASDVVIDFGSAGIWVRENDSTWTKLHFASPEFIVTGDMDGSSKDEVIVDFGSAGIWVWKNNSSWTKLVPLNPELMATGDMDNNGKDDVIIDFGPGIGIWARMNDSTWIKLHSVSPELIVAGDMDGGGKDEVIIDFGSGIGIWIWKNNSTWVKLTSLNPELMATGDMDKSGKDDVIIDFGPGIGIWVRYNDSSWSRLHPTTCENDAGIATGNIDGN
jgi:subtilisin family serine protease